MQHRYSYCLNQIGDDLQLTKLGSKACLGDEVSHMYNAS